MGTEAEAGPTSCTEAHTSNTADAADTRSPPVSVDDEDDEDEVDCCGGGGGTASSTDTSGYS